MNRVPVVCRDIYPSAQEAQVQICKRRKIMDKELISPFLDIIRQAGEIIQEHWSDTKKITFKGHIDLVTQTDVAVEQFLVQALPALLPNSTVLAEESHESLELSNLTWIIDPVDGTTNYAHGLPIVSISVALWREKSIDLGAIYLPMLGELFWAKAGQGAWLNGLPIQVSSEKILQRSLIATGFPYSFHAEVDTICERLRRILLASQGVRRLGSAAADLAYTACGRFEGFYETGLKPWDTAAGWLLVQEAGGKVTGLGGQDYRLGEYMIVASNGQVHEDLLALL